MSLQKYYLGAIAELDVSPSIFQLSDIPSLYSDISDPLVVSLFSSIHMKFNELFKSLNGVVTVSYDENNTPHSTGGYFHADRSRELLAALDTIEEIRETLNETENAFDFEESYNTHMIMCRKHIMPSGGSPLPDGFPRIKILQIKPALIRKEAVSLQAGNTTKQVPITKLNSGSYATVYQFEDSTYRKIFALKRVNSDLTDEEKQRFKIEFDILKSMKSPYIVEVYNWNEDPMEYTLECLDETVCDYIAKNKSLTLFQRKRLIYQVLAAFECIHSRPLLHRDISLTNVMLKHYDDVSVVKVTDFGLVKRPGSTLTRLNTEVKGSLADPELEVSGFENYQIYHEIFSLTRLIFYILTGSLLPKQNIKKQFKDFYERGTTPIITNRYKSVAEIREAINALKE